MLSLVAATALGVPLRGRRAVDAVDAAAPSLPVFLPGVRMMRRWRRGPLRYSGFSQRRATVVEFPSELARGFDVNSAKTLSRGVQSSVIDAVSCR